MEALLPVFDKPVVLPRESPVASDNHGMLNVGAGAPRCVVHPRGIVLDVGTVCSLHYNSESSNIIPHYLPCRGSGWEIIKNIA